MRLCSIGGVSNAMHMQAGSWRFEVHLSWAQRFGLRPEGTVKVDDEKRKSEAETEHQGAEP
jgi:hypothetical protein